MNQEEILKMMREFGKRGGESTKKKYGVDHFKKMSKLGVEKRKKLSTGQDLTTELVDDIL